MKRAGEARAVAGRGQRQVEKRGGAKGHWRRHMIAERAA